MSATNPQEEKSKPIGLSNKVLFIDYYPTQLMLDVFSLSETPMFKEGTGYYRNPGEVGPKIDKKADLFRFHIGRYYKQFPAVSVYGENNSNQKGVLNNKPITNLISGQGSAPAAAWAPRWLQLDSLTPATKLEVTKQYDLTEYSGARQFSPFHTSITKELNPFPGSGEYQQWILLSYLDHPGKPDNAKFYFHQLSGMGIGGFTAVTGVSWANYILDGDPGDVKRINRLNLREERNFTDHAFIYNFAVSKPEITGENSFFKTLHASVNLDYNYFMASYEDALSATNENIEQYLPNIYMFSDLSGKKDIAWGEKTNNDYKLLMQLEGLGDVSYWYDQGDMSSASPVETMSQEDLWGQALGKTSSEASSDQDGGDTSKLNVSTAAAKSFDGYIRKWSKFFNKNINGFLTGLSIAPAAAPEIFSRARNIIIPPKRIKELADMQSKKSLLPMSVEIEFVTDSNTEFSDFLVKANVWDNLLSEIISSTSGQGGDYDSSIMMKGYPEQEVISNQNLDSSSPQVQTLTTPVFRKTDAKVFNLNKWLQNITQTAFKPASDSAIVLDPEYINKAGAEGYDHGTLLSLLALKALQAKLGGLKEKNRRSFQEILAGDLCYNETVFYRVAKMNALTSEVIQNFYFVNSSEADIIKYVDTQVFYGKKYQYRIYAWQLVFGSEYEYKNVFFDDADNNTAGPGIEPDLITSNFSQLGFTNTHNTALIDLRLRDSAVLIEVPYYEPSPIRVLDDPPAPPGAQMIPYKNVGDKILIFLNPNTGEYELTPEIVENSDELALELLREAKGYGPNDKIRYVTDDYITTYEIFRTTQRPTSYRDFAGQKIATLSNEASFVDDTISPNTKYYYTFRSVDNHGFTSNPTEVYELEMVQNLDSVYPIVKTLSIEALKEENIDKGKVVSKTARKYFHIKPSGTQTDLNYEEATDLEEVATAGQALPKLGSEDQALIGKKFKIRLTSKKTGKRLDFNLDFRTSYDMTNIVIK